MFSIKFDSRNNLLTLEFHSNFDEQQGEILCSRLEKELGKSKHGFIVLSDLSKMDCFDDAASKYIQKMMKICNDHGVSKIFRVVPNKDKDIGFNIMSIFHYSKSVKIYTYESLEEARFYVNMSTSITLKDKIFTIIKILKIKAVTLAVHNNFRFFILIVGFFSLLILRQIFHAFGVSLGYLYITLIALSGFWFGIPGGVIAATISSIIFVVEVNSFSSWIARDVVFKTMLLRFIIYFISGIVLGHQSRVEKRLREKLEFLAAYDELTGFLNYRFTVELMRKELERSKRYKKNLTIAIIDIDHFKTINDTYGHLVGNDALKTFSKVIKSNLREMDIAGRYGGDEFILVFPESTSDQGLASLNRIKKEISNTKIISKFLINEKSFTLTFSAGLSVVADDKNTVNDLINSADKALYKAKQEGRDKVILDLLSIASKVKLINKDL
ncbi:MAG: GGDEF domain-containing protein [Candidatus Omnitrophica bacterium]|nr:GGDEF domain-containing protein [Candidatus Omnitrophota bacterium]